MLFKTTFLAILGLAAQVAVASPPACLIAALSSQSDPSDVKSICNSPTEIQNYLYGNCGNYEQQAIGAFATVCSSAGVTVSTAMPTSSSVSPTSSSSSTSSRSSSYASTTGSSTGTSSTDMTSSGSASETSGASTMTSTPASTMTTSVLASGTTPASASTPTNTKTGAGNVARLGMDCVGLAALGLFGAMLAL